ncbi:MAG: hypothetical protein ABW076_12630 [Candidatus Thiodiazotropha sp.]
MRQPHPATEAGAAAPRFPFGLRLVALTMVLLSAACDSKTSPPWSAENMQLHPLSPFHHLFNSETGSNRIDYFFIDSDDISDPRFRETLKNRVTAAHAELPEPYDISSIYIYRRTANLNQDYSGDADSLRGVYDEDLVSYSRWNQGLLDIFYLIDEGNVVFNLLEDQPVEPPWEFD